MTAGPASLLSDPEWPWRKAGLAVRLCANAQEPRLIPRYLDLADDLGQLLQGADWRIAAQSAALLLHTAADRALPLHWRSLCADHLHRPLRQLSQHALAPARALELRALHAQFAQLRLDPISDLPALPDSP